ncbi:protein AUXIN SIGNALING F-BOX 2-like [Capsicum galapagoense]
MGYLIGTGPLLDICNALYGALGKCTSIRSLSLGIIDLGSRLLPAVYPICHNLTSLKLSPCLISADFNRLIRRCIKLECLWVQGTFITDEELCVLASTCKELQELRIIDTGCPKLKKLNYICNKISNEALITVAENCPNLVSFTLHNSWECIGKRVEDVMAMQPLEEGFGAIVRLCKGLKRLRLCGRLTDQVFLYIGKYAKHLEVLTVNLIKVTTLGPSNRTFLDFQVPHFAGDSEKGILYVLNGCKKLKELDIRNSSFGNATLLEDVRKYEWMQCLYIENCQMNFGACKQLAHEMPSLNVEIIRKKTMRPPGNNTVIINPGDNDKINKMYLYRMLVGPRKDAPDYVLTL